jgi:putative membrane protein
MKDKNILDWFLRFVKGAIIGLEVVLPGISGAALAVVFGLYERIVQFVAHIKTDFVKNILFFLPVACGGLLGVYLVSRPMKFLFTNYQTPVLWFFVGAILGTIPQLWQKSGEKGRKPKDIAILTATFILAAIFFVFSRDLVVGQIILNPVTALGAGAVFAFTSFIPGFSSSNIWVIFGFYDQMMVAIHSLNFSVIIPFALGVLIFVFPFSRGIEFLLKKAFTGFFHIILGFVLASAILIIAIASKDYNYMQIGGVICAVTLIVGAIFSYRMCVLSKKYEQ